MSKDYRSGRKMPNILLCLGFVLACYSYVIANSLYGDNYSFGFENSPAKAKECSILISTGAVDVPRTITKLEDRSVKVRTCAIYILDGVAIKAKHDKMLAEKEHLSNLAQAYLDPRVVPAVINSLEDKKQKVRLAAIEMLTNSGDSRAIPALKDIARADPDRKVRSAARQAINNLTDQ